MYRYIVLDQHSPTMGDIPYQTVYSVITKVTPAPVGTNQRDIPAEDWKRTPTKTALCDEVPTVVQQDVTTP